MIDINNAKKCLQEFDFNRLMIEELGWSNPRSSKNILFQIDDQVFYRKAIAELSGITVFEITTEDGNIPDNKIKQRISLEIQKINHEHLLIFIDGEKTLSIWRWLKRQDKKYLPREHYYYKGQTGDSFLSKLAGLYVDIEEAEGDITIVDAGKKLRNALDIEKVTKKFYIDYQKEYINFLNLIEGIDSETDKKWYASVILNRLMFIYFLQKKFFLDNGNDGYLTDKLESTQNTYGKDKFYSIFLNKLFFEGFAKPEAERTEETNRLIGKIRYLNGGLFIPHNIEVKYKDIRIPDKAFENIFSLFNRYSWALDDTPTGKDDEINPAVLGYIFEKYINQKAYGAYYTRTEITEYLCEQTVNKIILDEINGPEIPESTPEFLKKRRFHDIDELLSKLDASICRKLVMGSDALLANLSLLDPACGSGAFLVAAMKKLIDIYCAVLGKIDFLHDKELKAWKNGITKSHPSEEYYIKKQIITNNLYGVDIMEEACEIAKLRLFLALVASALTVDQLEPLPNIDFNIMSGNSLIGLTRVDEESYNSHLASSSNTGSYEVVKPATLFKPAVLQGNLFAGSNAKSYHQLIIDREAAIKSYKDLQTMGMDELRTLRDSIREKEKQTYDIMNDLLLCEFQDLGIRYEQAVWDDEKNKEGKTVKRAVNIKDIEALKPFHWGYEFSEIFGKKNGFDAIITNPPWEVLQTDEKEFFQKYDNEIQKKKIRIEDWLKQFSDFMKDEQIRNAWVDYSSSYPYKSQYFKKSNQYKQLVSGKINLFSLFTIQCFNLLKNDGYCGMVIPSGIYTDLGTKQLRVMLFGQCKVTGLFCFENRKRIFEGVDSRFKFLVLSFEKGGSTESFPAAFMRHDVRELEIFPQHNALYISTEFIKRQSPDSLSIPEIKNQLDFSIFQKLLTFPMFGNDNAGWNIEFGTDFNMTTDSYLFKTSPSKKCLPLVEGKMFWQFTYNYAQPKYWLIEKDARKVLLSNNEDIGQKLDYQYYRLGFRDIAASTNERCMVMTILPPNIFCPHTVSVEKINLHNNNSNNIITNEKRLLLLSFCNSYIFDFYIKNRVTNHLSFFIVKNVPVPILNPVFSWYKTIIENTARLICTTAEFADLWKEVMQSPWDIKEAAIDEAERNKLRAELDGIAAHIYGLTEEEFAYILTAFPIVPQARKDAAMEEFRKIEAEASVNNAGSKLWREIIDEGESDTLEFKSTLRVDLKTGRPEKAIEHGVLKTIAAFLNSEGGTLLIGVEDNKNIFALDMDFNSFSQPDKIDEFRKHLDNIIERSVGDRFHHYLKVDFQFVEGKRICVVAINEKSKEPVYIKDEKGQELFYIRRSASTVDLKPSEAVKYIREHWE